MNRAARRQAASSNRTRTIDYLNYSYQMRYFMDFMYFPEVIHKSEGAIELFRRGGSEAVATTYNRLALMNGCPQLSISEFSSRVIRTGNRELIYITMPASDANSPMVCTHIAITYTIEGENFNDVRIFHVERGSMIPGMTTTAIGEISESCHANYGEAYDNDDDNIRYIIEIASE